MSAPEEPRRCELKLLVTCSGGADVFSPLANAWGCFYCLGEFAMQLYGARPKCIHCREELRFEKGRGWVHREGLIYKQRLEHGEFLDDHAALPDVAIQEPAAHK